MKYSREEQLEYLKKLVRNDRKVAGKWLTTIYKRQMDAVGSGNTADGYSGVGFTPLDRKMLSPCAEYLSTGKELSDKQWKIVLMKMPQYAGQILATLDPGKLETALDKRGGKPTAATKAQPGTQPTKPKEETEWKI